jgi:hypothetical protein
MPHDLDTYQAFNRWFAQRAREAAARDAFLQAQRHKPIRRTGPTTKWVSRAAQRAGGSK